MKPIIAILAEVDSERNSKVLYPYVSSIEKAGGIPLVLPYLEDGEAIDRVITLCDGFFFTGGADISPLRYGEEISERCGEIQYPRDELELTVFQKVIKTQKPILAVCRGAQLVNVALGGSLCQDLPDEAKEAPTRIRHRQSEPKFSPSHNVNILADTPLRELIGEERMSANSFHHQAINVLGQGLAVMATADDNVIEAVYLKGYRYLRAYQWHPERLFETEKRNRLLFEDFVSACARE